MRKRTFSLAKRRFLLAGNVRNIYATRGGFRMLREVLRNNVLKDIAEHHPPELPKTLGNLKAFYLKQQGPAGIHFE